MAPNIFKFLKNGDRILNVCADSVMQLKYSRRVVLIPISGDYKYLMTGIFLMMYFCMEYIYLNALHVSHTNTTLR